ncbi:hypothetical protein CYMTET_49788 [Cymbomonas tetramitiformis]|uniref:carbonic anhydrase n=1 Tax=Cymbomonas tetramitiformis TaxID=36881 RepID=A0AAE0BR58_9CHLO|nr:hypothetical protein CYMTET_49788 [Cymbomonas tetramitiformis]
MPHPPSLELDWTYNEESSSALGPDTWAESYPACGGQSQSPITLPAIHKAMQDAGSALGQGLHLNGLCTRYKAAVNSHTWKVTDFAKCNDGGPPSITYQGEEYTMLQFHWHAPSEHSVAGKFYDAETHFVHQKVGSTGTDDLLVIGVLLAANSHTDNAFLADYWPHFDNAKHDISAGINPYATFFPDQGNTSYYAYSGSLTTPPCDETVQWIVLTTPVPMSYNQLSVYKAAVAALPQTFESLTNNRPIQDLHDRTLSVVSDIGYTYAEESTFAPGPDTWAESYPACGGQSQSPITLPAIHKAMQDAGSALGQGLHLNGLCTRYKAAVNSHTWKVTDFAKCNDGGPPSITYQGEEYTMLQFHWHAPSEHSVAGKFYDAETHFVHQKVGSTGTDDLLVIGVLLAASSHTDNAFLADFWPHFDNAKHDISAGINPYATFFPDQGNTSYYAYSGSLTTPPCDETVQWIVLTTPVPMSYNQLSVYKAAVAALPQTFESLTNNRPIQDLHDRTLSVVSDIGYTYAEESTFAPGPDTWAESYPACGGQSQSPITLPAIHKAMQDAGSALGQGLHLNGLCTRYKAAVNSHTWKVTDFAKCNDGGPPSITYQGEEYTMLQFHWHAPSEHSVAGKFYDAETHFVHQKVGSTGTDDLLVIGVLLAANSHTDNAFLADFWPHFDNAKHDISAGINPYATFFPDQGNTSYYAYSGSLTTPPCDETVQWIVLTTPVPMSYNQLSVYKAALAALPQTFESLTNNRPIQDLNDRKIQIISDASSPTI